jgi:ABC-type nitrate/sulfonate/bicarbonate transport system permease component
MARVYGLDRRRIFFEVVLPRTLASILVGLRYGLGITWLTLIVVETVSASSGIGYLALSAREILQTDGGARLLERGWLAPTRRRVRSKRPQRQLVG